MSNDKSAEEIVRELRELLPPQVDYAELVCAEGFAHGQHYVWEDPEPYIINAAADLIESLQAKLAASQQETRAAVAAIEDALGLIEQEDKEHRGKTVNVDFHSGVIYALGYARGVLPDMDKWRGPHEESFVSRTIDGVETAVILRHGPQEAGEERWND